MPFFLKDTEMELGYTAIENIFIDDFMPTANGTYVKVYLLAYKFAKNNGSDSNFTNSLLARHLRIPLSDVLEAWDFWEKKGVIEKQPRDDLSDSYKSTEYNIVFKNLTELYIKSTYSNFQKLEQSEEKGYTSTPDDLVFASQNSVVSDMFERIDGIMRRPLQPNERLRVLDIMNSYNIDPEVIVKAFYIGIEKNGRKNIPYVEGILRNWIDMGIRTEAKLNEMLSKKDKKLHNYMTIKKSIGATNTLPTESEKTTIDTWTDNWGFNMDMILKACEKSINTLNPSVNYINGVLKSWYEKGLTTPEAVTDYEKDRKKKLEENRVVKKENKVQTKFHNFKQVASTYTNEELERIWRENQ